MKQPLIVVLFGPPGAGKGTQIELHREYLQSQGIQLLSLSTGEKLRSLPAGNLTRRRIKEIQDQGGLVANTFINPLVMSFLIENLSENQLSPIFLDGFPRNKEQALWLAKILKSEFHFQVDDLKAIELSLSEDVAVNRIVNRPGSRTDDNAVTARSRYRIYLSETAEAISALADDFCFFKVNGEEDILSVRKKLMKIL